MLSFLTRLVSESRKQSDGDGDQAVSSEEPAVAQEAPEAKPLSKLLDSILPTLVGTLEKVKSSKPPETDLSATNADTERHQPLATNDDEPPAPSPHGDDSWHGFSEAPSDQRPDSDLPPPEANSNDLLPSQSAPGGFPRGQDALTPVSSTSSLSSAEPAPASAPSIAVGPLSQNMLAWHGSAQLDTWSSVNGNRSVRPDPT